MALQPTSTGIRPTTQAQAPRGPAERSNVDWGRAHQHGPVSLLPRAPPLGPQSPFLSALWAMAHAVASMELSQLLPTGCLHQAICTAHRPQAHLSPHGHHSPRGSHPWELPIPSLQVLLSCPYQIPREKANRRLQTRLLGHPDLRWNLLTHQHSPRQGSGKAKALGTQADDSPPFLLRMEAWNQETE